ncbi:MAG: metal-sensitive transcriptional regulator [Actinomycetes bacterium]
MSNEASRAVLVRLRRAHGQLAGVIAMVEAGRPCEDVVTQLAAASKALERAGFALVASSMRECALAEGRGEAPSVSTMRLERLFLSLA